jgi:predicted nucleotidyltransferase
MMKHTTKNLTRKELKAIAKLKKELLTQIGRNVELILFGSKARGEATKDSDIDILALVNGEVDYELTRKIRHIAYDIERNILGYETFFQLIVRSKQWWKDWKDTLPFAQNVAREGIWL